MDPLSITASCVGLVATIARTSTTVTAFVRDVRDARRDLDAVSRELLSLKTVLELLAEDTVAEKDQSLPASLQAQITSILTNCNGVVVEIENGLSKHEKSKLGRAGYWTVGGGKGDMAKLRSTLEAHKSALEIALEMLAITITRDIKNDTTEILNDTAAIKDDTAQILKEIACLQARLPAGASEGKSNLMLQRYLDSLTTYAETVCDTSTNDRPHISQSNCSSSHVEGDSYNKPTIEEEVLASASYLATSKQTFHLMSSKHISSPLAKASTSSPSMLNIPSLPYPDLPPLGFNEAILKGRSVGQSLREPNINLKTTEASEPRPTLQIMPPPPLQGDPSVPTRRKKSSQSNPDSAHSLEAIRRLELTAQIPHSQSQTLPEIKKPCYHSGGFTVEIPVNDEMASSLPAESDNEYRYYRYSAITRHQKFLTDSTFESRQRLRHPDREFDVLVAIDASYTYLPLRKTLRSIARDMTLALSEALAHRFVLCIFRQETTGSIERVDDTLRTLIGVPCQKSHFVSVKDMQFVASGRRPKSTHESWLPTKYKNDWIRYHMFEYTPRLEAFIPGSDCSTTSGRSVQLICICRDFSSNNYPVSPNFENSVKNIGAMLQARTCVVIDAGYDVKKGDLYKHHKDFCGTLAKPEKGKQFAGLPTRFYLTKTGNISEGF